MPLPTPAPDRTAVVTGASSGIGRELARQLAERGHGVTLVARRADRLDALSAELRDRTNVRVEVVPADVARSDDRRVLIEHLGAAGLEVSILVNNAGVGTTGPVEACDPEAEVQMVRVDVEAVVDLCSRVVPQMVQRRRGAVLNVASCAAYQPLPGQAGYGAAKAFVLSYTQALRAELAGHDVSATALCPGPVKTEFADVAGMDAAFDDYLPKAAWVAAAEVARQGLDGLGRNRAVVIPGVANRLSAAPATSLPDRSSCRRWPGPARRWGRPREREPTTDRTSPAISA